MFVLETSRLVLHPHDPERDIAAIGQVMGDPIVMQHIGQGAMQREAILDYLIRYRASWDEIGFGGWTIRKAEDHAIIGNIFMKPVKELPEIEVGYTFGREFWKQGFATESLKCILRHAREDRKLDRLIGLVRPENYRSSRLLTRCGFKLDTIMALREKRLELYAIELM